jgi:hypothetical protein
LYGLIPLGRNPAGYLIVTLQTQGLIFDCGASPQIILKVCPKIARWQAEQTKSE